MATTGPSQDGSAHVVLIVVLILVVLGGVGFVGYRALMKRDTPATVSAKKTGTATSTRDLVFADWNVKVIVADDSGLYVEKDRNQYGTSQTPDGYYVYDKKFDEACGTAAGISSTAAVTRVKASDMADSYISEQPVTYGEYYTAHPDQGRVIGDYAYIYSKPNGGYECTDPSKAGSEKAADAEGVARASFYDAFLKLKAE